MIGPGGPKACARPEAPGLAPRQRKRDDAAETARQRVRPGPAGDDHDLRTRARAIAEPERPAAAVGTQAGHTRAEPERRAVALGGAHEAVGDEQRLGVAARRLVAADREVVRGQARLELEDAVDVAQLGLDAARAHRLVDAADGGLALGRADDQVAGHRVTRLEARARLHVGEELAARPGHVDDRGVGVVLPAHARRRRPRGRPPRASSRTRPAAVRAAVRKYAIDAPVVPAPITATS